uniref:Uncharacterized protein n=1 Tax=Anopheles farauti TaxID=69004 RepID=A0A182QUG4_9DIPT
MQDTGCQVALERLRCGQKGVFLGAQKSEQKTGVRSAAADSRSWAKFCSVMERFSRIASSVAAIVAGTVGSSYSSSNTAGAFSRHGTDRGLGAMLLCGLVSVLWGLNVNTAHALAHEWKHTENKLCEWGDPA